MTDIRGRDTEMGIGPDRFPATPWSAILRTGAGDPGARREALQQLVQMYWRSIYAYVRRKWGKSNEDAKDLTQAFVASILEKEFFQEADRDRGRFRALLRTALENFLRNQYAESKTRRRGGAHRTLSLDAAMEAEGAEIHISESDPPEDIMRREWTRTLFGRAVNELRRTYAAEDKERYMAVFDRYQFGEGDDVSYDSVAKELGLKIWDVTNYLADARRRLRGLIEKFVREYCVSEEDFREEISELFGDGK
jgi:RNA polymerase sigma factor (sigma-70 family)